MPAPSERPDGAPVWIDLSSSDIDASIAFYSELFGWTHETAGPEFNNYVNFSQNGNIVAGLAANPTGEKDAWTTYLKTSDAQKTASKITGSGGTVQFVHDIPGLGSMVILADPAAAPLGAWQPGGHSGFRLVNEHGAPAWHELHTNDFAAAVGFYESVFGWTMTIMADSDEFRMSTFAEPGKDPIAGIFDATTELNGDRPYWKIYFAVDNADDTSKAIEQLGGTIQAPAVDTPFGRMAHVADSSGAGFSIVQVM